MVNRTVEWLNANRYRRYPFRDDTNLACTGGRELPNNVLLDCRLVSCTAAVSLLTLLSVEVTAGQSSLLFCFGYGLHMFYVEVPAAAAFPYQVAGSSAGFQYTLVFGEGCTTVFGYPVGVYNMTSTPVIQPALTVVQDRHRVDTVQATGEGQAVLSGLIYVEPGYNCDPTVVPDSIRLSAGLGYGAGRYCERLLDAVVSCADAILWWNGQNASEDGNIEIRGGQGVDVDPQPENHRIVIRGSTALENLKCG